MGRTCRRLWSVPVAPDVDPPPVRRGLLEVGSIRNSAVDRRRTGQEMEIPSCRIHKEGISLPAVSIEPGGQEPVDHVVEGDALPLHHLSCPREMEEIVVAAEARLAVGGDGQGKSSLHLEDVAEEARALRPTFDANCIPGFVVNCVVFDVDRRGGGRLHHDRVLRVVVKQVTEHLRAGAPGI